MKTSSIRPRLFGALGAAALAGTALLVPSTAAFAEDDQNAETTQTAAACQVDQATLGWGMKQSFRTYITGSFANGSWELSDGVEYIEPALEDSGALAPGTDLFQWSSGSGEFASDLASGLVSFTGEVHFTGHSGALQLNISNPAIEFDGEDTAYLLLEIGEAPAGETVPQVRAAKIDTAGALTTSESSLTIDGAVLRLTAEGAEAFNGGRGSYVSGVEMDPVFLTAEFSGCELGAVEVAEDAPEAEAVPISEETSSGSDIPWLPIIIGGVALIVIGVAVGLLVAGRPKNKAAASADGEAQAETPTDSGS